MLYHQCVCIGSDPDFFSSATIHNCLEYANCDGFFEMNMLGTMRCRRHPNGLLGFKEIRLHGLVKETHEMTAIVAPLAAIAQDQGGAW